MVMKKVPKGGGKQTCAKCGGNHATAACGKKK